jgi:LuxR family maltose regulon positive regulatory protein
MAEVGLPWIAATKLSLPSVRAQTVERDRLTRRLAEAAEVPLTVVCASAGFGKTTALVEWLRRTESRGVWVSVDAQDNDPRRLCAHLLTGLDRVWPGALVEAETALVGGSDLVETVVPLTADALAERVSDDGGGLTLVLDDYHLVTEQECHRVLTALVDSLPPGVRVVVSSRTVPPLRLGRRRAAGTVAEIGPRELAFQGAESELLLNGALGLGLSAAQLRAIDERVDGWPAGLALVASSLPAKPDRDEFLAAFAASQATVAEFLIEEVLDATDRRMREFLCRTSVLNRLSAPLCAAVLEDSAAGELLEEVRRSNLFVTVLDGDWVRYHHLFAELLQRELRRSSPELVPELHRRAASWFEQEDLTEEAIRHASLAGDGEYAATLLNEHWLALFDERRYATLRRLIAGLPAERGRLGPFCDAVEALCMGLDGVDLRLVAERLDALESQRDAPGVAQMIDHSRMSPYYGDVGRAVRDGWATWERSPNAVQAELAAGFAVVLWFAGDHHGVRRVVEPYLNVIERPRLRSWALASLALTAADEGHVELAERYAREAVDVAVEGGSETALECHFAYVALGEALRLRGALDDAAEELSAAAKLTSRVPGSLFQAFTLTFEAQLDLTGGDRHRARAKAEAARRIIDSYPDTGALAARLATIEATLQNGGPIRGSQPTPSELRVLELLARDLTRDQIAAQLFLTVPTVKSHIRRLYRRLGAQCRAEAIAAARHRRLI